MDETASVPMHLYVPDGGMRVLLHRIRLLSSVVKPNKPSPAIPPKQKRCYDCDGTCDLFLQWD
jgi:hypothetical protein